MNLRFVNRKLGRRFGTAVRASLDDGCIVMSGRLPHWSEVVKACQTAAKKNSTVHVVNDIVCDEVQNRPMRLPSLKDCALDGRRPDVLIIGGGISGVSIARELSKWKLDILLVEKEADLALQTTGRNDGEVHPGVDLCRGSKKHFYIRRANHMYEQLCRDLDVPFKRVGQYVGFENNCFLPFIVLYCFWRRFVDKIEDTRLISGAELKRREPNLNHSFKFAIYNPSAACVSPYQLCIAYAENAVTNGATVSLNTAVLDMKVENGQIQSVETNRGTVYPRLVVNAAGVFAEDVARLAGDRFFSIHPRRGTNSILDKKAGPLMRSIASIKIFSRKNLHSKGGGILNTAHGNLLVGPDAVETWEKENTETSQESIDRVFAKQKKTLPCLTEKDIITYFTGVRAPTFEEDYIIEFGRKTHNLIHCAGIQSPGLTTAPAVALDIEKMAVDYLSRYKKVERNEKFDPVRHGIPTLNKMSDRERDALIRKNPDYGVIVCRCEEISKGEVLDALRAPICVPTLDGIKKRVRPGMGRCQGGFCSPLVTKIIADYLGVPLSEVKKSSAESPITFGPTK